MRTTLGLVPVLFLSSLAAAQNPSPTSPFTGTWTLNVAQSKLHPPGVKAETGKIEPLDGDSLRVKYAVTGTDADGKPISVSYDGRADGKQYPAMSNGKEVSKIAWRRPSSYEYTGEEHTPDGSVGIDTLTMARNGKRITIREHVTGPNGTYDETTIWDKQ